MKKHGKLLSFILAAVTLLALAAAAAFVWPGFLVSRKAAVDGRWVDDAYGTVFSFDSGKYYFDNYTCAYETTVSFSTKTGPESTDATVMSRASLIS